MAVTRRPSDFVVDALKSMSWTQLVLAAIGSYISYHVLLEVFSYWRKTRSPMRHLPGPKGGNPLFGHMGVMFSSESNEPLRQWARDYGNTFAIRSMFGAYQLVTTDTRANTHVLFASHIYQKPALFRRGIARVAGEGVLWAEGEQHRDQRRIINPAFGFAQVRELTGIFLETALQLREIWTNKCMDAGGNARIDAYDWLNKATLDAIGKAGFDYEFGTLNENGTKNELAEAFEASLRKDNTALNEIRFFLNNQFPILRAVLPGARDRAFTDSKNKMDAIGMRIIEEKKQAILAEIGSGRIEKKAVGGKDLISQLLKANLAEDLEPSQRLSDQEVLAQIPTFLLAGHETTSNSTTWAMYALAMHPEMQKKLRAELQQVDTDTPTLDVLNSLSYLDQVTRETLRLYTVLAFAIRQAVQDDIIPLGTPIKDRKGNIISNIRVQKGDEVQVPIFLINRSKEIWGPDADEFRPERWDSVPSEASAIPGITPNLLSFIGGPRSCVGHRFAVAEMKALLFHIVRGFEFRLAVEPSELWSRTGGLMRVQLRKDNSVQLPLFLTPVA